MDEIRFFQAMGIHAQSDVERMITIDETYKDQNTARRGRGWGYKGNGGEVINKAWFENVSRYTLISTADIHSFIPVACHTILRDEISDEGVVGTVNGD